MTNEKGKDLVEEVIDELATYAEKEDSDGLIVEVPMTPSYYPPILYKRVEPGRWFVWLEGAKRWGPALNSAFEHIFQTGIKEGKEK